MQIKVSSKSKIQSVAGSIVKGLRDSKKIDVTAIGAFAVNQAVKSIAKANDFLKDENKNQELLCLPQFDSALIEDRQTTAITFHVILCAQLPVIPEI